MPLSDEERRVLDRLEEDLTGPVRVRKATPRDRGTVWPRLILSTVAALAGLTIVLAGVAAGNVAGTVAGTGGFVLIVGAIMFSSDILAHAASAFITLARPAPEPAPRRPAR